VPDEAAEVNPPVRARRVWWVTFALLTALGSLWAVATPLFASADEPSHAIRAWSLVHGTVLGDTFGPSDSPPNPFAALNPQNFAKGLSVKAPKPYQDYANVSCVAFNPSKPAGCVALGHGHGTAKTWTYTGRYFPAYYVVVGLPTLLTRPGEFQIYLMRLASVLVGSALLASAITAAHQRRAGVAAAGVLVANTPMVLFFVASINPSGLEMAAGIAVWASGALLASKAAEDRVDGRMIDRFAIAAIVLTTTRPLSPLYVVVAVGVLAIVAGRGGIRVLWGSVRCRWWAGAVVAATFAQLGWNAYSHVYDSRYYPGIPSRLGGTAILRTSFGKTFDILRQMVGVFGWLDTPAPGLTFVFWLLAVGALIGLAGAFASRRWALATFAIIGVTALLPPLLEASQARDVGFGWQGRYTVPLAAGIPVLAAFSLTAGDAQVRRRIGLALTVTLSIASWFAYAQALRRYAVGADGRLLFVTGDAWGPPIASALLLVVYLVATVGLTAYCTLVAARPEGHRGAPANPGSAAIA
jgi:hypothetical protein